MFVNLARKQEEWYLFRGLGGILTCTHWMPSEKGKRVTFYIHKNDNSIWTVGSLPPRSRVESIRSSALSTYTFANPWVLRTHTAGLLRMIHRVYIYIYVTLDSIRTLQQNDSTIQTASALFWCKWSSTLYMVNNIYICMDGYIYI